MQPVTTLPVALDRAQEWQLVIRARGGDREAYHQLVESHQRFIFVVAYRIAAYYQATERAIFDPMDLVGQANVDILAYERAILSTANPCTYMHKVAANAIRRYCKEYRSIIRTPRTKGAKVWQVLSLDYPLNEEPDRSLLDLIAAESL